MELPVRDCKHKSEFIYFVLHNLIKAFAIFCIVFRKQTWIDRFVCYLIAAETIRCVGFSERTADAHCECATVETATFRSLSFVLKWIMTFASGFLCFRSEMCVIYRQSALSRSLPVIVCCMRALRSSSPSSAEITFIGYFSWLVAAMLALETHTDSTAFDPPSNDDRFRRGHHRHISECIRKWSTQRNWRKRQACIFK